jgi:hypothetical protein
MGVSMTFYAANYFIGRTVIGRKVGNKLSPGKELIYAWSPTTAIVALYSKPTHQVAA